MSDEAELQARIAALAGQINQRKHRVQPYPTNVHHAPHSPYAARGGGWGATRGRRGRAGHHQPIQNRTWVAGGTQTPASESAAVSSADELEPLPASRNGANGNYVQHHGVGKKELMSKETYKREQKQKEEYKQARARENQEQKSVPHIASSPSRAKSEQSARQIQIEGISFQVRNDGRKLVRVSDALNDLQETPKKATIAGVDFYRTKRGNLMRVLPTHNVNRTTNSRPKQQCETFTRQGSCPFGPKCHFAHDPEKVAICKSLLLLGTCPAGDYCDMSHEMSYHRVSACSHFLRGNCTKEDACRYPHINISPSAPVCRTFATLGYCAVGDKCERRHVFECPDHANRGLCTNVNCQLPHYDRASTMRKAAQRQANMGSEGKIDLSSDDDDSIDEVKAEESELDSEDAIMSGLDDSRELSQQQDYVSFS